jgi:hypothetical protein
MRLFPFLANLNKPRITSTAPQALYVPVRATSDSNLYNAYESIEEPPRLNLYGNGGWRVNQSPGSQPSHFLPIIEYPTQPNIDWFITDYSHGGGELIETSDSNIQQELF